jgi:integrase
VNSVKAKKGNFMLTAKKVERTKTPGRYRDGIIPGLLLQISESGAKSWILRYELRGRERMLGLGSATAFNLKEARERARSARQLLADGVDPLDVKRERQAEARLAAAKKLTFAEAAERYFNQHQSKWTNTSHRDQFLASLRMYAFPVLGDMDVAAIQLADVLRCIEPVWTTKAITADRVRNRIENVLDWCVVRGHRPPGTNPARWTGHLDQVLPAPREVAPRGHFAALPYVEVPGFMAELRQQEGIAARALEFLILTAARRGEALGARWDEIDFASATWIVPAHRMKAKREHRVPLSPTVLSLLYALPRKDGNPYLFIGAKAGQVLGDQTLARVLKRMGRDGITTHGMRSAFSDWAHEQTAHSNHTIEISLAHAVGSDVEKAYRRGPMVAKRARLMADWAKYCATPSVVRTGADVVAIGGSR